MPAKSMPKPTTALTPSFLTALPGCSVQKAPQAAEASPQRTPEYEKLTTLRSPFVMMSTTPVAARQKAASSRIETGLRVVAAIQPITKSGPVMTMMAAVAAAASRIARKNVNCVASTPRP